MKRDGVVFICASFNAIKNLDERRKLLYNVCLNTNETLKHPYAHKRKGRARCGCCTNPEISGRYKRKQLKHEMNRNKGDLI